MRTKVEVERKTDQGVISLEACIVIPVFFFLMMFFYGLFIFFVGEHCVTHALIQSAESLAMDPFSNETLAVDSLDEADNLFSQIFGIVDLVKKSTQEDAEFSNLDAWYKEEFAGELDKVIEKRFRAYFAGLKNKTFENHMSAYGISEVDFSESSVNSGVLTVIMKYKQSMLLDFNGYATFERKLQVQVKLFENKNKENKEE